MFTRVLIHSGPLDTDPVDFSGFRITIAEDYGASKLWLPGLKSQTDAAISASRLPPDGRRLPCIYYLGAPHPWEVDKNANYPVVISRFIQGFLQRWAGCKTAPVIFIEGHPRARRPTLPGTLEDAATNEWTEEDIIHATVDRHLARYSHVNAPPQISYAEPSLDVQVRFALHCGLSRKDVSHILGVRQIAWFRPWTIGRESREPTETEIAAELHELSTLAGMRIDPSAVRQQSRDMGLDDPVTCDLSAIMAFPQRPPDEWPYGMKVGNALKHARECGSTCAAIAKARFHPVAMSFGASALTTYVCRFPSP